MPISHVQAGITKRCFKTNLLELVGTASYCLLELVKSPPPIWLGKPFSENSELKQACFHEKCPFWGPNILQRKRFTEKVPCFALSCTPVDYKWAQWTVPLHLPFLVFRGDKWEGVQRLGTNFVWMESSPLPAASWLFWAVAFLAFCASRMVRQSWQVRYCEESTLIRTVRLEQLQTNAGSRQETAAQHKHYSEGLLRWVWQGKTCCLGQWYQGAWTESSQLLTAGHCCFNKISLATPIPRSLFFFFGFFSSFFFFLQ